MREIVKSIFRDKRLTMLLSMKLAGRKLQTQYRRNALGFVWLILAPLAYAFIFVVIKRGMRSAGLEIDTGPLHPGLFAFIGIAYYHTFLDGLLHQLEALRSHKNFVANNVFPPEAIFLAESMTLLPAALVRTMIFLVFAVIMGTIISPQAGLILFALSIVTMMVSHAIGILLAPFAVLYADFGTAIRSFSLGFLLLSPVFYPAATDPDTILYKINMFNPLAPIIQVARASVLETDMFLLAPLLIWATLAAMMLIIGIFLHRKLLPILAERIV